VERREFIALLGSAAVMWPLAARAQQPAMPVIGFLSPTTAGRTADLMAAFRQGLSEAGYFESQNVAIEYRWTEGHYELLAPMADDLVTRHVAVIVAPGGGPATFAAKAATSTIPIVFLVAVDPVGLGLVASLARPGGNLTGVSTLNTEVGPKRLELLHELVPSASDIALLVNPTNLTNTEATKRDLQTAADRLGLKLHVLQASKDDELDTAFARLTELHAGGLVIGTDGFLISRSEQLAVLALRHAVPAIFQYREFAATGGLMSYGSSFSDSYYQVGVYTGRILNGEKPADLPVVQSKKVELILNLKTAKMLGLTVPLSLLGRADEVIE
jgi:putative tryptophan/tyrosine transport system substrate-binding protein